MTQSPATLIPAGTIIPYLGGVQSSPPAGWLYCDGSDVPRDQYGDLFAAISTSFGSSSPSTFKLPTSMRLMAGANTFGVGNSATDHTHSFETVVNVNATSESNHNHTFNNASTANYDPSHYHWAAAYAETTASSSNRYVAGGLANYLADDSHKHYYQANSTAATSSWAHSHNGNAGSIINTNSHSHSINTTLSLTSGSPTSGGSPVSDYPPYILIWHIIKT